jgi:hypothetical protein
MSFVFFHARLLIFGRPLELGRSPVLAAACPGRYACFDSRACTRISRDLRLRLEAIQIGFRRLVRGHDGYLCGRELCSRLRGLK